MPIEDGNSVSTSPRPSEASETTEATEEPIEVKERNLSDGFLQIATALHEIVEEPVEPTPTLFAKILSCFARVFGAFFRR
jgi:hypothetical protein